MKLLTTFNTIFSALVLLFGLSAPAYAYLDPGTGSIIIQGIIASIAFGLATMKMWWYRISALFSFPKNKKETDVVDIGEK